MIRRPPRSTLSSSSAASDVYKRQLQHCAVDDQGARQLALLTAVGLGAGVDDQGATARGGHGLLGCQTPQSQSGCRQHFLDAHADSIHDGASCQLAHQGAVSDPAPGAGPGADHRATIDGAYGRDLKTSVSYTHLTLPTKRIV